MKIIVAGPAASGKSTIAYEIAQFLESKGFTNVALRDEEHAPGWDRDEDRNARLNNLKHMDIEISVMHLSEPMFFGACCGGTQKWITKSEDKKE